MTSRAEELAIQAAGEMCKVINAQSPSAVIAKYLKIYGQAVRDRDAGVCEKSFPSSWLDPLMTGPKAPIKDPNCPQIEAYTNAIKNRCAAAIKSEPMP